MPVTGKDARMSAKAPEPRPDRTVAIAEANFRFNLGDRVQEMITKSKGVITGRCQYLTGCNQYSVVPEGLDKDGKPGESRWWDEDRLTIVGKNVGHVVRNSGGPSSHEPPIK